MKIFSALIILITLLTVQCSADICDDLGNATSIKSEQCMNQLKVVCRNTSLLWRMFDASSKYPISGMSYGSNTDLGNFDECIDINHESFEGNVKGKYCGLSVAIINPFLNPIPNPFKMETRMKPLADTPSIQYANNLTQTRNLKLSLDDLLITALSICIPDACTPEDVGKFFVWGTIGIPIGDNKTLPLVVFPNKVPCMTKDSNTDFKWGDIVFIIFLVVILLLIVWSTAYDWILHKLNQESKHPLFLAFSLMTNGKKLLHTSHGNPDQIQCLNGMRFISMMWVIAGHGFVAMESAPLINYSTIDEYIDQVWVQYIASAPIAVDTFFFLSGFLLSYGYLKSAVKIPPKKQLMGVPMMYIHRYLRLTPALAVAYFAAITIYRMLGTGPLWDAAAISMKEQCEKHWWSFFLYIQNYVNYDDMCLNHTWYLSADMQMFLLSPLVLIPIAILLKDNKTKLALIGLGVLTVIWIIIPIAIRLADDGIKNVYDSHSRFNDYLIGVILGVILHRSKGKKYPFSKLVNLAIWCGVLIVCVAFNLYYHNVIRIYEHTKDTLFYGFYRPVWCCSLAWMVYSCYNGYGGPVNWFLSLPVFQIGGRLSYCMYLLHAIVEMYWVGLIRTPYYWGDYMIFYVWCGHFIVTMLLSAVWSLCFESPMIVIEKFLFGGSGGKRPQKEEGRT